MRPARSNWVLLAIVAAAAIVCGVGWHARQEDFLRGYLTAFLFWMGVPLGAMVFLLMHQLTGGDWGVAIRRPASACVLTLPLMAVAFVPVIVGLGWLYPWAGTAGVRQALHLGHKGAYLNSSFFVIRAVAYFVIWIATGFVMLSLLARQDQSPNPARAARLRAVGAVGLILYILTATFAAVDWMMSLEPQWYSSIYGFYVIAGQGLAGMAMMIAVVTARDACKPVTITDTPSPNSGLGSQGSALPAPVLHDLGNLLFMTVFFYAYIAFSQFLIIWSGNTTEEVPWYIARNTGTWGCVPAVLAATHFALPFALLLSRRVKRRARAMFAIALLVLAAHVLDTAWMVLPSFPGSTGWTWLLGAAAFVAIGGAWWAMFVLMGGTSVPEVAAGLPGIVQNSEEA